MKQQLKGAAKRLTFSLLVATALGGCAIYEPGYPGYAGYDPYPYGQPAYAGVPYYAGQPAYAGVPYYAGPPVSLGLWFSSRSGGGHHGHHGGHHGGHRGGWGGRGR